MNDLESRARRPRHSTLRQIVRPEGFVVEGQPVLCTSCGSHDGWVPTELPPGVIYLCGECEAKFGVPDELSARADLDAQRTRSRF